VWPIDPAFHVLKRRGRAPRKFIFRHDDVTIFDNQHEDISNRCAKNVEQIMDWDNIRVFLAVARTGQILGAAKHLRLNHATVSRRLSAFEHALQAKLFVRRPNGCGLTEEGERLLVYAERVESDMLAAYADIGHTDLAIEGNVRVGAPDGFGVAFLAPRLGRLKETYPGLMIQLVPIPRTFSLSRREADIAVTLGQPDEGRLIARKLTDYTLGLYASKAYLERAGTPSSLADLKDHVQVGYVEDLLYSASLDFAKEMIKGWRADIEISSAIGQTEAVRAGAGIGILHTFIGRRDDNLVPVLPDYTVTRSYWTVVHEDLRAIRRVSAVAKFIAAEVSREKRIFCA
jgi:DNA-binding transcriptional LysR family regulator